MRALVQLVHHLQGRPCLLRCRETPSVDARASTFTIAEGRGGHDGEKRGDERVYHVNSRSKQGIDVPHDTVRGFHCLRRTKSGRGTSMRRVNFLGLVAWFVLIPMISLPLRRDKRRRGSPRKDGRCCVVKLCYSSCIHR